MSANILLIEYEPRYIDRVRKALSESGHRLEITGDLESAVERCADFEPQLVIVTSVLPRIKIEDAITQLRARAGLRATPVLILMSGYRGSSPQEDAARYGAQDILERPFSGDALVQRVEQLLEKTDSPAATQAIPQDTLDALRRSAGLEDTDTSLTSDELFGDILDDVEEGEAAAARDGAEPAAPAAAAKPDTAGAKAKPARSAELTVEQSLADVLVTDRAAGAPKRAKAPSDTDVDAILSKTLAGLDIQPLRKRRPTPPPEPEDKELAAPPEPDVPAEAEAAPEAPPEAEQAPPEEPAAVAEEAVPEEIPPEEAEAEAVPEAPPEAEVPPPEEAEAEAEPGAPPAAEEPPPEEAPGEAAEAEPSAPEPEPRPAALAAPPGAAAVSQRVAPPSEAAAAPPAAEVPPKQPAPSGTQFGQYALEEHIATGGMAEVYQARMMGMEGFQKTVAIKRILPHLTDNDEFVTMFIDEAKLAAQLNHNNIIHIYDLGKIDRSYYIAMEYIQGRDLRSIMQECRERKIIPPIHLSLYITTLLASALDYAHKKRDFENRDLGLVHRDVSPQNVLISNDGLIKLCDFGIAKAASKASHTRAGALKGKLQYMSPEQAWGKDIDHRSDIFSLGLVLYEMLTGEKVFAGDSELSILEQVRNPKVDAPSAANPRVTADIDRIVLKALEPDRTQRYQSARDLQRNIEKVMRQKGWAPDSADVARFVHELTAGKEITGYPPGEAPAEAEPETRPPEEVAEEPIAAAGAQPEEAAPAEPEPEAAPEPTPVEAPVEVAPSEPELEPEPEPELEPELEEDTFIRRAREEKRQKTLLFVGVAALIVVFGGLIYIFRGGGGEGPPTPTPVAAVIPPSEPTPTETPSPELEELVRQAAEARLAEQEDEIRRRIEAQFPTPTPIPPTPTPTPTMTPTPMPTAAPTRRPPTPVPTRVPTATPIPPTPTPAVREGDIVAAGPGVTSPVPIHRVEPRFPPAARQMRASGTVQLQVLVGIDGSVEQVRVLNVSRTGVGFESSAEEAVRQWRYKPASQNGVKVRMWVPVRVPFKYR